MEKESIAQLVDSVIPQVTEIRHKIHQNPELAGVEHGTAALIRASLAGTAIRLEDPYLETDVIGMLEGTGSGKNVTLRADIDALPLNEESGKAYASQCKGLMHGCGHDGHTANLIGTALVLNQLRDRFSGTVRFVFQPGEEVKALGRDLVASGALENPAPDAVFALHAHSGLEPGVISGKTGAIMAAAGFFSITITGKGGHASQPEMTIDPIITGVRVVDALQHVVARVIPPQFPAVLSVCRFSGGQNSNVIPEKVELEGTFRYFEPSLGEVFMREIERIVTSVCEAHGAQCAIDFTLPYIPTINNSDMVARGERVAKSYLGEGYWHESQTASMGGEDFCYYLERYPGAFFRLGNGVESPKLHNPQFDFNDEALRNGITFLTGLTLDVLSE